MARLDRSKRVSPRSVRGFRLVTLFSLIALVFILNLVCTYPYSRYEWAFFSVYYAENPIFMLICSKGSHGIFIVVYVTELRPVYNFICLLFKKSVEIRFIFFRIVLRI